MRMEATKSHYDYALEMSRPFDNSQRVTHLPPYSD